MHSIFFLFYSIIPLYQNAQIKRYVANAKTADKSMIVNGIVLNQYNAIYDHRFSAFWRGQISFYLCVLVLFAFSSNETLSTEPSPEIHLSTQEISEAPLSDSAEITDQVPFSSPPLFCYFHPPKGWEIVEPNSLSPQVKMAFIKKNKKEGFCPSLNLAIEKVEGTLNEYLSDVKLIYEQDRKNHWRKLGKVRTPSGEAQLTEVDTASAFGPVRILQLILLKEGRAYIITAAALKKDFCSFYRDFQETFHSLTITEDLFENIPQLERRTMIKQEQENLFKVWREMQRNAEENIHPFSHENFQKNHWIPFQKKIIDTFEDMGSFWQVLVLLHVRQTLEN